MERPRRSPAATLAAASALQQRQVWMWLLPKITEEEDAAAEGGDRRAATADGSARRSRVASLAALAGCDSIDREVECRPRSSCDTRLRDDDADAPGDSGGSEEAAGRSPASSLRSLSSSSLHLLSPSPKRLGGSSGSLRGGSSGSLGGSSGSLGGSSGSLRGSSRGGSSGSLGGSSGSLGGSSGSLEGTSGYLGGASGSLEDSLAAMDAELDRRLRDGLHFGPREEEGGLTSTRYPTFQPSSSSALAGRADLPVGSRVRWLASVYPDYVI